MFLKRLNGKCQIIFALLWLAGMFELAQEGVWLEAAETMQDKSVCSVSDLTFQTRLLHSQKPYRRENPPILEIKLQNISEREICIARQSIEVDINGFPFMQGILKGPRGQIYRFQPWYDRAYGNKGVPSYQELSSGEFARWHFEVQSATQAYHWDWFGSWGLPAGNYEITLIYDYPCKELSGNLSPEKIFGNRSRIFSLPDPKGVITIIAAGEGRRPKPVVKFS